MLGLNHNEMLMSVSSVGSIVIRTHALQRILNTEFNDNENKRLNARILRNIQLKT